MIRKQLRESFFLGLFALVTVCLLSPSASAIKISDNFSVDGFLDMSAGATIAEDEDGDSELTAFAGYDQLELALKFSFDKLSGRADIDGNDSIGDMQVIIPNLHPIEASMWLRESTLTNSGLPFFLYS